MLQGSPEDLSYWFSLYPELQVLSWTDYEIQYPEWLKSALIADRKDLLRSDAFRSLIFILLSAGVILGFIFDKLRKEYAILIIAVLVVVDLWTVDKRYLDADRFERCFNDSKILHSYQQLTHLS